ncbi:hypothetical protein [Phragmitibacter flavus]|uniref:hypothetical protein n=1 Tax=Phragmitibacter flavus TaxID=2576071 RepID=UPI0019826890|nr:hypothetical protein [Phragmitibacter flavus]
MLMPEFANTTQVETISIKKGNRFIIVSKPNIAPSNLTTPNFNHCHVGILTPLQAASAIAIASTDISAYTHSTCPV